MKNYPNKNVLTCFFLVFVTTVFPGDVQAQRARREHISVNTDVYEISVLRDGSANINTVDTLPIFRGAQARVCYAGEERFRRLNTDANSSRRFQVNDHLGQGQGLVFDTRSCQWYLRAYPGQPYFSVRLVFKNTGKSPVTVAALSPWFISPETKGAVTFGGEISNTRLLCFDDKQAHMCSNAGESQNVIVMRNPTSRRMIVAGFLTHNHAETHISADAGVRDAASGYGHFQAVCVYDPPVIVSPGATLESEDFYVATGDMDISVGMERYGAAVATAHGLQPRRPRITSGLDLLVPDERQALSALRWQQEHLWNWNFRHVTLGLGWEITPGDWQPAPERFPNGFAPMLQAARDARIDMAVRLRPFQADKKSAVAKDNPEWLLPYKRDKELFVLNVALEQTRQWLTDLAATLTQTYGFHTLILEDADCLLHCELSPSSGLTRTQFYRLGLQAVRAGIGNNKALAVTPWHPAALPYADAGGISGVNEANWTSALTMEAAMSLQAHLFPTGVTPDAGVVFWPEDNAGATQNASGILHKQREQSVAWLAAAAMNGSPIRLGNLPQTISAADVALLGRFSPPLPRPAYTVNVDDAGTSAIKHLAMKTKAGEWHLVAFFNWSRFAATVMPFDTGSLGLDRERPYTLYEFLPGVYHGLIKDTTTIAVPPASVRLFGLRPYAGQPMLLASDRHISQGALDHQSIEWDEANKQLTGVFRADTVPYRLRFLVPPPWQFCEADVSVDTFELHDEQDDLIELIFTPGECQTVTWRIALD